MGGSSLSRVMRSCSSNRSSSVVEFISTLLSFVRHDYFRRLFCRWLADKVATGEFPDDPSLLLPIVENVCYRNARVH